MDKISSNRPMPKDVEIQINPNRYIVSKTDPKGVITYANAYFASICGYTPDELVGKCHNIIRHPDMPRLVFKMLWDRIAQDKDITLVIKNLAKDGSYYWVSTKFESVKDPITNKVLSFTAYRQAVPNEVKKIMSGIYQELSYAEQLGGMELSNEIFDKILARYEKSDYDELINAILINSKNFKR
ncbi:PAS domain-containing protein [Campylobacter geochelonis]|uniref:PAS domain-containing protein n=1 Tax=Campylobacter geochelonis TaxID=1780362 RepID=UPI0007708706|nr:PAS domain-containing protein [Campylobacter geochelonis]CZE46235.1 signal-transduction sensor protein [Campylobacter geochelonis]